MIRTLFALPIVLAVSLSAARSEDEIARLRAQGYAGLDAAIAQHLPAATVDAIAAQRDASASKLFWYTDFAETKRAAKESGKPILSLSLLGRLDEELSCANSRFFRTTLYPDPRISKLLREKFILHWQSVRPAPRITIDFGDGKKIERTITGNSIHYVLDSNAKVIDALPGLASAAAFDRFLNAALTMAAANQRDLETWHAESAVKLQQELVLRKQRVAAVPAKAANPDARAAAPITPSKTKAESPMLAAISRDSETTFWTAVASVSDPVELSPEVLAMIKAKSPHASPQMIDNLKQSIAADTARNEFELHERIHEWLTSPGGPRYVDSLNERVYAELFLTPSSDPWLGLAPPDVFAAIDNDGKETTADARR